AITVLLLCTVILVSLSARGLRWVRRNRGVAPGMIMLEEDVVDDSDIKVVAEVKSDDSEEIEVVEEVVIPTPEPEMRPPTLPLPESSTIENRISPETPAPPPLNMPVICPSCSSRFEIAMGNSSANCPVCDERIIL
ncbi:MAG: hypothetical protein VX779_02170, partial [Candidatus Thermoplasmatota archaeon]|nr:hypothetical protein [Candidatus Thermoplasmatota archaeon]